MEKICSFQIKTEKLILMDDLFIKKVKIVLLILISFIILVNKLKNINRLYFNYNNNFNGKINNYIYNDLNFDKKLNYIKKLKKVVYTIILGGYDKVKSIIKENGYDYFLITDNNSIKKIKNINWTILDIPEKIKNLNISLVKKQRFIKLHPHLFFKKYDLSIYIDGTFIIKGNLDEFLLRIFSPNFYLYTFEHPTRNSIFKEIKACIMSKKEKKSMGQLIFKKYKQEKFPDNKGLIESCLLIRKHNEQECINIMNNWYEEIKNYSHRDQLSFNYIYWKNNIKLKYITKKYASKYFYQQNIHLIKTNYFR